MTLGELLALLAERGVMVDVSKLKLRQRVVIEKYDKTDALTPGVEGLAPIERVDLEFEDGELVRREITASPVADAREAKEG